MHALSGSRPAVYPAGPSGLRFWPRPALCQTCLNVQPKGPAGPTRQSPLPGSVVVRSLAEDDASPVGTAFASRLGTFLQPYIAQEQVVTRLDLKAQVISSIYQVSQEEWDACATGSGELNPFLLWSFLKALEDSQSAVREQGWLPQHVLVRNETTNELLGCCPMFLKLHSYGEYVFDHGWASAAARMGMPYYPKLQSCVPFTPVTGQRMMVKAGPHSTAIRKAMAETLIGIADELQVSGLHVTFNTEEEWAQAGALGYLQRTGIQYHWENRGYHVFDDFLMELKQSKRKNIRQERKGVANAGLRMQRLTGDDLKAKHWDAFFKFYRNTTDRKWGQPYLTREFFHQLGETMPDRVMLVVAEESGGGPLVAGALNLIGSEALYGRNWGCGHGPTIKHLHFELCYYQAIEAAIELGLARVEAGAQGEHKIQRGYLPSLTYSSHYIRNEVLRDAIDKALRRERMQIAYTLEALTQQASPFKDDSLRLMPDHAAGRHPRTRLQRPANWTSGPLMRMDSGQGIR
ncbi:hypothetical protein WJX72_003039 [[Myrmecia] bisecta]|uniref:GNAT family N-acetyltransferase n=1 Tax=[Myrmecia] bisecta TaxID=41462 RepID=A0AAW1R5P4_9CHLO